MSRADWRRAQNNLMVRMVNDTIKATKPWVKFGIGPAGVAGKENTSAPVYGVEPCPTPSSDWQYNQIYADPLAWYNETFAWLSNIPLCICSTAFSSIRLLMDI